MIVRVGPARSYALNKLDGAPVPKMWNVMLLKRYYNRVFFKGVINKISFNVFFFNFWAITNQVSLKALFPSIFGITSISKD